MMRIKYNPKIKKSKRNKITKKSLRKRKYNTSAMKRRDGIDKVKEISEEEGVF